MNDFINSLEQLINQCNWYAALVLALTLPDICAKHSSATSTGSQARYAAWFNQYVAPNYTYNTGVDRIPHIFLNGNDCYALRCSLLHEGGSVTGHQQAHDILDNFQFVSPPVGGGTIHCNQSDSVLQLQIDIFSLDMLNACKQWWSEQTDEEKVEISSKLLTVY